MAVDPLEGLPWAMVEADSALALAELPDNSVDALIMDPPYGLSDPGFLQRAADRIFKGLADIQLPYLHKRNAPGLENAHLPGVAGDPLLLDGVDGTVGIDARVGVPERAVHLNRNPIDDEINDGFIAPANPAQGNLPLESNPAPCEFLGDFVLQLGDVDPGSWVRGEVPYGGLAELLPGGFAVLVGSVPAPGGPDFVGDGLPVVFSDKYIGPLTDALGGPTRPAEVVALPGTVNSLVLRLDVRGRAAELVATRRAPEKALLAALRGPRLVGAPAPAGSLAAEFEPLRVRFVADPAHGALPRNLWFHLWLPRDAWMVLDKAVPRGGFMGKQWDAWVPQGRIWSECFRVLKPGGFLAAFGGSRTSHHLTAAVERAGFEIRDTLAWLYGQGFPKSLDVAKAFDKAAGVKPLKVEPATLGMAANPEWNSLKTKLTMPPPTTPEARQWVGWGTALKPAHEPIVVARKPLAASSVIGNIRLHRTGAMNIDGCRVGTDAGWSYPKGKGGTGCFADGGGLDQAAAKAEPVKATKGRWPANVLLMHTPLCTCKGTARVKSGKAVRHRAGGNTFGGPNGKPPMKDMSYADADGMEEIDVWDCAPGCQVENLGDKSRFFPCFFTPKPSKAEKNKGLEHLPEKDWREGAKNSTPRSGQIYEQNGRAGGPRPNNHPTTKPVKLMRWLVRLLCPPGGVVLDPFAGSGTTGVACAEEGMRFLGVEQSPEYAEIAVARLAHAFGTEPGPPPAPITEADPALEGFV